MVAKGGALGGLDLSLKLTPGQEQVRLVAAQDRLLQLRLTLGGQIGDNPQLGPPGAWAWRKPRRASLNCRSASRLGRWPAPSITTSSGCRRHARISAVAAESDQGSAVPAQTSAGTSSAARTGR